MPKSVRVIKGVKPLKDHVAPLEEKTPYRRWQAWRHLERERQAQQEKQS